MLKKKASAANAAYSEKEIRKQLAKNRGARKIEKPDSAPEMEKENPLEGQTFKERIAYLRGLNGAKNKEAATKEAKDVNIEKIEDDVLIERPIPMTMASTLFPIKDIIGGMIITTDGRYIRIMEVLALNFLLKGALEQEMITNSFEAFLRIAPQKFQIKSVAKRTDISSFAAKMEEDYYREKNLQTKKMIADGRNFLLELGNSESVSRRYFFVFEVPEQYTKGAQVDEIREKSQSLCNQYAAYLQGCGNKVMPGYDDTKTVTQMLFDIMNRNKNSTTDFDTHFDRVYEFYQRTYGERSIELIPMGEFVTPYRIDMRGADYIKMDDMYYGFYFVRGDSIPAKVYTGWVSNLTNMGEGIDVDIFIEQQKREAQAERIRRNLMWKKHDIQGMSDTNQDFDAASGSISSGYYLKQGLASGNEFYYANFLITITADSLELLRKKMEAVKDNLRSKQIMLGSLRYEQDRVLQAYMPLCNLDRKIFKRARRNVLTSGLASYYPFCSSEICDENGILLGVNEMSDSICMADFFDTTQHKNANIAIMGCTGAGKSYLVQLLAMRLRMKGIQVFILAPDKGHEFIRSCNAIGGEFIHVSPGSKQAVNVMEIRPRDRKATDVLDGLAMDESELSLKIQTLHNFFKLLFPEISPEEDQILDDAMILAYKNKGITHDNDSLWDPKNPGHYRKMPLLGDVYEIVKDMPGTDRISGQLRRLVSGSAASLNQQTNVDLDNQFIVFDVSTLKGTLLNAYMFMLLDVAYAKAKENRTKKKAIIIDEAWQVIGSKSTSAAADQILEMFKIIRGYGGSAICATQDLKDFFALEEGKYGSGIINACNTKIVLNLEKKEADTIRDLLDLSQDEYKKILQFDKGHALLSSSGNNVPIHIRASRMENNLITTDRGELERIMLQMQSEQRGA